MMFHDVGAAQVQLGRAGEHAGHGQGGDTKKVAVVAGRRRRGWYGDGGGGDTEAAAAVARRGWQRWHGEGGGSGT